MDSRPALLGNSAHVPCIPGHRFLVVSLEFNSPPSARVSNTSGPSGKADNVRVDQEYPAFRSRATNPRDAESTVLMLSNDQMECVTCHPERPPHLG